MRPHCWWGQSSGTTKDEQIILISAIVRHLRRLTKKQASNCSLLIHYSLNSLKNRLLAAPPYNFKMFAANNCVRARLLFLSNILNSLWLIGATKCVTKRNSHFKLKLAILIRLLISFVVETLFVGSTIKLQMTWIRWLDTHTLLEFLVKTSAVHQFAAWNANIFIWWMQHGW